MPLQLNIVIFLSLVSIFGLVESAFIKREFALGADRFGHKNVARTKREANTTHLDDPKDCLQKCNNAMMDKLWSANGGNRQAASADNHCKAQLEAYHCFDRCPQSQLKAVLNSSRELTTLSCSESGKKYSASYPCLQKILPPANTTCDTLCQEHGNSSLGVFGSIRYYDFGTISYELDGSVVAKQLAQVCKLFQCKEKCTVPSIDKKCGKETAQTSSKITKGVLNQCINTYKALEVLQEAPSECKAII